jgi:predicted DNA binding CopG/RHH family protein
LEKYVADTYRLLRSQSWGDNDYPSCVLNLFNSILKSEGEEKTKSFIDYVLNEKLKDTNEEFMLKNQFLINQLNIKNPELGIEEIQITFSHYLKIEDLPDGFYRDLQSEINRAYNYGLFSVIPFLIRKFIENLIIDIFKKKYGTSDIEKYYDPRYRKCHSFIKIVEILDANLDDFTHLEKNLNKDFIKVINKYRESGNSTAHSISIRFIEDDIEKLKSQASEVEYVLKLLIRVLNLV